MCDLYLLSPIGYLHHCSLIYSTRHLIGIYQKSGIVISAKHTVMKRHVPYHQGTVYSKNTWTIIEHVIKCFRQHIYSAVRTRKVPNPIRVTNDCLQNVCRVMNIKYELGEENGEKVWMNVPFNWAMYNSLKGCRDVILATGG